MQNLFLQSMDTKKVSAINEIKANKEFALSLIKDLDDVFHTNYRIQDREDSVAIRIKTNPSLNDYGSYVFSANKDGIKFYAKVLCYYSRLGKLYEKHKDSGTTADANFLAKEDRSGFGWVEFYIPILRNDNKERLLDTLKDIVVILEHNRYTKRF
jgi:hypothetical protein